MKVLEFLFESPHYRVTEDMYKRLEDPVWVEKTIRDCDTRFPNTWNVTALVAIAQYGTKHRKQDAQNLLLKYVEYHSTE